jgi:replication initiation and membrane attachment protein DnaB
LHRNLEISLGINVCTVCFAVKNGKKRKEKKREEKKKKEKDKYKNKREKKTPEIQA